MKQFSKDLGNVSLAPKGKWSREQEYEKLALVYNACDNLSYVAKIDVPSGVDIENREYWQPMNATGYADNNFINLTTENENGTITAYESLEEAVATILPINRRAGATLSFYNLNSDRLDRQAEFELWQFNSTDLANWENKDYWNNVYYNWNVFVGWYIGADALKNHVKVPNVGQYAYVGSNLNDAVLYQCRTNGTWTNTGTKVRNYISVIVSGNITIGDNGNWFSNGKDTGIPATPAVDEQLDNIGLQLQQHNIEIDKLQKQDVSLKSDIDSNFEIINNKVDNIKTATDSKIDTADANLQKQITGNDDDIATLNKKHESLSKTIQGIAATGGASTATNVIYNKTNSGLNAENAQDAIDELQKSKIDKTLISQESGNYENKVMSQKAVSTKLEKLSSKNTEQDTEINKKFNKENVSQEIGKATDKVVSQNVIFNNIKFPVMKFRKGMMEITNEIGEDGNITDNAQINVLQEIKYIIFSDSFSSIEYNRLHTIPKKTYTFKLPSSQSILCWNYKDLQFEAYCLRNVFPSYCVPILYIYYFDDKILNIVIDLTDDIIGIRIKNYKNNSKTYYELNNLDSINIRDVMPDNIENEDLMEYIKTICKNVKTIYIDEGDYKVSSFFFNNNKPHIKYYSKNIIGLDRDKCTITCWDFKNNTHKYGLSEANFINATYKNLTLCNCGFGYSLSDDFYNEPFYITVENVVFNVTLDSNSRYLNLIHSKHCKFTMKDCIVNVNDDIILYTALWVDLAKNLIIDNCIFNGLLENDRSKHKITHPIAVNGVKNVTIKNNKVYGGTTGIITRVDKTTSLEHFTIEHNTVESAKEEGISFDCFGNNVELHPTICELSIDSAEYIEYTLFSNTNKSLKMYCTARNLKGSHPNETWQNYSLIEHKDYLKDFYIYFSTYAGDVFGGTICKCLEVGEDDKGAYVIADISFNPATLELTEDKDPKVGTNDSKRTSNFKRASIVSGMFAMSIKNNIIRNTKGTGLALFCGIYNSVIDGNTFENCAGGCYMFSSIMLAVAAFTPCCNNKIINNSFIGGGTMLGETGYGFTFYGYAEGKDMLCYNNVFANNYLNTNQLYINNVKNLTLIGNILDGNTTLRLKNTVETNVFGTKLPVAPLPGQHFFNITTKKEMMYNGDEWIEIL